MYAYILSGGKGERLHPMTFWMNKHLIPVAGKPCVRWIVEELQRVTGYIHSVLCINQGEEELFCYEFRDIGVSFSSSPLSSSGTSQAVYEALNTYSDNDDFLVLYGDDLTFRRYEDFLRWWKGMCGLSASLVLSSSTPIEVGVAHLGSEGTITAFNEKPEFPLPFWVGVGVFKRGMKKYFRECTDIAGDTIPKMISSGEVVGAYTITDEWLDIGNISHLRKTDRVLRGL